MAEYLASIYGTEKDKVNCSFYFKIGACRHGDRCSRKHVKPTFSQTLLIANLYKNPAHDVNNRLNAAQLQNDFDLFYEDVFMELAKFGEVEEMVVCENVGEHLVGNVYCQFRLEEDAGNAVNNLNNRFYGGRPIYAELSPVTDFREACCKQHEISDCNRGGFCNFMHLKHPSRQLRRELYEGQRLDLREKRKEEMRRDEEERRSRDNYREDDGHKSRERDRDREYRGDDDDRRQERDYSRNL